MVYAENALLWLVRNEANGLAVSVCYVLDVGGVLVWFASNLTWSRHSTWGTLHVGLQALRWEESWLG